MDKRIKGQVGWILGVSGGSVNVMGECRVVRGSVESGCHELSENIWFV